MSRRCYRVTTAIARVVIGSLLVAACGDEKAHKSTLAGEWDLRVQSGEREPSYPELLHGRIVFDEGIPCYCDEVSRPPEGAIIGRGYLSYRHPEAVGGQRSLSRPFRRGSEADRFEEVVGLLRPDSVVEVYSVGMVGISLTGSLRRDSIGGSWAGRSHSDIVAEGTFVMKRIRATEYTDSALSRSKRGVRQWRSGAVPPPRGAVDTARTVEGTP